MRLGNRLTARSSQGREIAATAAHAGGPMATVVKPAGIVIAAPRDFGVTTQPEPK